MATTPKSRTWAAVIIKCAKTFNDVPEDIKDMVAEALIEKGYGYLIPGWTPPEEPEEPTEQEGD